MINKASFKSDIFDAIFQVAGKTWAKVTGVVILNNSLIMLLAILPVLALLGADSPIFQLFSNPEYFQNNQEEFRSLIFTGQMGGVFLLILLIVLFVGSWGVTTNLRITNAQVLTGDVDFRTQLASSFTWGILKMVGITLFLYMMFVLGVVVAAFFAVTSLWLTVLFFLFFMVFFTRFMLVIPAIFVGGMNFSKALEFSLKNITWLRALKLLGIIAITFLITLVCLMVISMLALVASKIPFVGVGLQYLIQWILVGIMATLGSAALVGLYYRYDKDEVVNTSEGVYGELPSNRVE